MASKTTNSRRSNSAPREPSQSRPHPWIAQLETRHPIGGESFIRLGDDPDLDQELYVRLYMAPDEIASPDVGLDVVVDFIAETAQTIPRLIAEIRRLRSL